MSLIWYILIAAALGVIWAFIDHRKTNKLFRKHKEACDGVIKEAEKAIERLKELNKD